jgi:signal transduction histidine kinase
MIALHQASLELVKDVSLETLLERIASVACEQAGARYAAVGVLNDDGGLKQFISVGMSPEEIKRMAHPPVGRGLIGELMHADRPLRVPVIANHPHSSGFPPYHPKMTSFLGVPIRAGDRQLGQIYLTDKIAEPEFTADDEKIIQMLAAYAAAAIQNARLYEEMREHDAAVTQRNEDQALVNSIATTLTSSLQLDEILNQTLALVMKYMKVEAGEIFLLEEDKQTLRMVLHRGEAAEAFWTRNLFRVGEGFVGLAAEQGVPILVPDLTDDARFMRGDVVKAGFRQLACIPLRAGESVMGVLNIFSYNTRQFEERSIQMLTAVCNWAGLAIENARLHTHSRRLAVLEERDRIGMDLHDGIIQSIYGVGLALESVYHSIDEDPQDAKQRIQHAIDGLNQAIRDIRAYILDLRPRQLGNDGLLAGIRRLVTEYRANTFSEVDFVAPRSDLKEMPHSHSLALFHICQEALANTAKHSHAKTVNVSVWVSGDRVLLEVRDNGRGFHIEKMTTTIGHGLSNMQTRARAVGGEVDITSAPGEGTTILAWVPRGLKA